MKAYISILFLFAQALVPIGGAFGQFQDNFSDGNISLNPTWMGDTSLFIVNGTFQLQLMHTGASGTQSRQIHTKSEAIKSSSWEFYYRLDFDPSTSNYANVYLCSDVADVSQALNGYFVRIGGESGTIDDISLFKQTGATKTKIIDGADGVAAISPRGKIRVTRDSLGNWELLRDTSSALTGFISEGVVNDGTHITTAFFGLHLTYTSTRSDKFYFDDFTVTGSAYGDTIPPQIQRIEIVSPKEVRIFFNEKVSPATALDSANYSLSYGVFPPDPWRFDSTISYYQNDSSAVVGLLKYPLDSGRYYRIAANKVKDFAGNAMSYQPVTVPFPLYTAAKVGEVVINEIMADPTPPVALPDREYVELYNATSNKIFNISQWIFSDPGANGMIAKGERYLAPNEKVILCSLADTLSFGLWGYTIGVSPWPSLNNSGDGLVLSDSSGNTLDAVDYTEDWYKDEEKRSGGFSLERINPFHPCSNADNWMGSQSLDGGTPSNSNSVFNTAPDTIRPEVIEVKIVDNWNVHIIFSKQMDTATLQTADVWIDPRGKYNGPRTILPESPHILILTYSTGFDIGRNYSCRVEGAMDCLGNKVRETPHDFGLGRGPAKYEVVINELFPIPNEEINEKLTYEYVELLNTGSDWISLDSCFLADASAMTRLRGVVLPPRDFLLLCPTSGVGQLSKYGIVQGIGSFPSLNNTGDHIQLLFPDSTAIHDVDYKNTWYEDEVKAEGGWSLEMKDPFNPCGAERNWSPSTDSKGGTPGVKNSIASSNPDIAPPVPLLVWTRDGDTLWTKWDERISESDTAMLKCSTSDGQKARFLKFLDDRTAAFIFSPALATRQLHAIDLSGFADCSGNTAIDIAVEVGVPESAEKADVVINEVLFNPFTGASSDYAEIYNRSPKYIDLQLWSLANYDDKTDTISSIREIITTPRLLAPKAFALMSKSGEEIAQFYSQHNKASFIDMASLPAYNNSDGSVVLLNDSGEIIDRFDYDEEMHFPLLKDFKGVSLERIDAERPTSERGNWHSAAQTSGFGTPGLPNSQAASASDFSDRIVLEPQTFSPDNDGFDDVLFINYHLPQSGYMCSIHIYDSRGKHILQLVNNEMLGKVGTWTWDGRDKDNQKAVIGLYIVAVELFDLNGKALQIKKTCVLATRF
jgi:hypothetical protein